MEAKQILVPCIYLFLSFLLLPNLETLTYLEGIFRDWVIMKIKEARTGI